MALRSILGFLVTLSLAAPALANTSKKEAKAPPSSWSGFVNVSRSTSLYDFQDGTKRDGIDYMGRVSYRISENYSTRAQIGYSQDLIDYENDDVSNLSFNFSRAAVSVGKYLKGGYLLGLGLPTSRDASKFQSLQASVSGGVTAAINPDLLLTGFSISGSAIFVRNFHQYITRADGPVNTEYAANQSLSFAYNFSSGVYISASFAYVSVFSYQNVMRNSFEISQDIGYQVHDHLSLSVGHTNGGSALKANGTDSNIQILNENDSTVYASATVLF
ncbi:hypothetical protein [Bdellovibrio reynosensis]|uniref:Uncharacterized protein n=1 Tax=Bdellovibrio reynosensis TaxID=2835041 RepID=A0ABY4CB28_9BACT|nr:hypothetical protein [Bdellovibrio reynosensis]UOF01097.1 hypothetical protein MNR06_15455 [Bdellovibrio reynosensis]